MTTTATQVKEQAESKFYDNMVELCIQNGLSVIYEATHKRGVPTYYHLAANAAVRGNTEDLMAVMSLLTCADVHQRKKMGAYKLKNKEAIKILGHVVMKQYISLYLYRDPSLVEGLVEGVAQLRSRCAQGDDTFAEGFNFDYVESRLIPLDKIK